MKSFTAGALSIVGYDGSAGLLFGRATRGSRCRTTGRITNPRSSADLGRLGDRLGSYGSKGSQRRDGRVAPGPGVAPVANSSSVFEHAECVEQAKCVEHASGHAYVGAVRIRRRRSVGERSTARIVGNISPIVSIGLFPAQSFVSVGRGSVTSCGAGARPGREPIGVMAQFAGVLRHDDILSPSCGHGPAYRAGSRGGPPTEFQSRHYRDRPCHDGPPFEFRIDCPSNGV